MQASRNLNALIRLSWFLATVGALILAVAIFCLAVAIWHVAQLNGYGPTYIVVSPWSAAVVVLASLAVTGSAALIWRRVSSVTVARRLSLVAIIATLAAWAAFGAAFLVLTQDWGAA